MHPTLLTYPHVSSYSAFILLAFFFGYLLARSRAKRAVLPPRHVDNLVLILLPVGLIGARLFARMFYMPNVTGLETFKLWDGGGLVFYGGFIACVVALLLYGTWAKLPLVRIVDIFAPSAALGLAIGRIGCFMAGCCWGDVCIDHAHLIAQVKESQRTFQVQTLPALSTPGFFAAVQFPERAEPTRSHKKLGIIPANASRSAPVHPVQIYEAILAALLAWRAHAMSRTSIGSGQAAIFLLAGYGLIRFGMEFLRADNQPIYAGLTISQVVSLGLFASALILYPTLRARSERFVEQPAAVPQ